MITIQTNIQAVSRNLTRPLKLALGCVQLAGAILFASLASGQEDETGESGEPATPGAYGTYGDSRDDLEGKDSDESRPSSEGDGEAQNAEQDAEAEDSEDGEAPLPPTEAFEAISDPSGRIILNARQVGKVKELKDRTTLILESGRIGAQNLRKGTKLVVLNEGASEILAYLEATKLNRGKKMILAKIQQSNFIDPNQLIGRSITIESNIESEVLSRHLRSLSLDSLLRPGKRFARVHERDGAFVYFDTKALRKKAFTRGERFVVLDEELTTVIADLSFVNYPRSRPMLGRARITRILDGAPYVRLSDLPIAYHQHVDLRIGMDPRVIGEEESRIASARSKKYLSGISIRPYGSSLRNQTLALSASYIASPYPLLDRLLERSTNNQVNWISYGLRIAPPYFAPLSFLNWIVLGMERGSLTPVRIKIKANENVGDETVTFSGKRTETSLCVRPNLILLSTFIEVCPLIRQSAEETLEFSGNLLADADTVQVATSGNSARVGATYYGIYPFFAASDLKLPTKQRVELNFGGDSDTAERKTFVWRSRLGWQKRFSLSEPGLQMEAALEASYIQDRIDTNGNANLIDFDYSDSAVSYGIVVGAGYHL